MYLNCGTVAAILLYGQVSSVYLYYVQIRQVKTLVLFLVRIFAIPVYHAVMLNHTLFSVQMQSQTGYIAFSFKLRVTI